MVDSWEAGETIPSEEQVRRIATLTFPIGWFYLLREVPELGPMFWCSTDDHVDEVKL